ncbi:MAG: DUF2177 family protein [Patescibacteria group bacterium]
MKTMILFLAAFVLFILLDLFWFSFMGSFFKAELGSILRLHPDGSWNIRLWAGVLTYVVLAIGVMIFVLPQAHSLPQALLYGALLGFVSYAVYDLTNMATLSGWTLRFLLVDIFWGTSATALVSLGVKWIAKLTG